MLINNNKLIQLEELNNFEKMKWDIPEKHIMNEPFKLIISRGGLRFYYGAGIGYALNKLCKQNIVGIRGVSAGSVVATAIATDQILPVWLDSYYLLRKNQEEHKSFIETLLEFDETILPHNAHILANKNKLEVVMNEITWWGLKKTTINYFYSRDHLIKCVAASCCIPFLTYTKFPFAINIDGKYYIDGAIMNPTPPVEYDQSINQLVIDLTKFNYPIQYRFQANDPNIHKCIIQGGLDMVSFLNTSTNTNVIQYHRKPIQKSIIVKYLIIRVLYRTFTNISYFIMLILRKLKMV